MKKSPATIAMFLMMTLMLSGCAPALISLQKDKKYNSYPTKAFVQLKKSIDNPFCEDGLDSEGKKCEDNMDLLYGSGAVIDQNQTGAYILTAAHICKPKIGMRLSMFLAKYDMTEKDIQGSSTDYFGESYKTSLVALDRKNDLCVVHAKGMQSEQVLSISKTIPERQHEYYNMAAPLGVFQAGMVLMFDGLYAGQLDLESRKNRYDIYTIPSTGGSSGSPILNDRMQVVGIISMGVPQFPHLTISPRYSTLIKFLKGVKNEET